MIALQEAVRQLAPRCEAIYTDALAANVDVLDKLGITANPLRASHWLAQALHETDGGTIVRESGAYSAERLLQIFGAGRSSAAVTPEEAQQLAHNGPAIFDRVYGVGNPHLARELGNTQVGDGWNYRGNCWFQTTGRAAHHTFGDRAGVSFEAHPEMMATGKYSILPAAFEWADGNLNALADQNNIRAITRKINGGYNGFDSRVAWFEKTWALMKSPDQPAEAWAHAAPDDYAKRLQTSLNDLGYQPALTVDGRFGPATTAAIKWFQMIHGLNPDGIDGPVTQAAINLVFTSSAGA